jgi:glycosyltransferase involved in cell wall biosynthesis
MTAMNDHFAQRLGDQTCASDTFPSQQDEPVAPNASGAAPVRGGYVIILGLRGIPHVQGGVEKHVEMLATSIAARGWKVDVIGRSRYLPGNASRMWNGVQVTSLWAPQSSALEAIVHTFLGVWLAAWRRPDILHLHAVGPALMVPLARLFGTTVVVTHHGYDYNRQKWGRFARATLKLGEILGMRLSHHRIAVSDEIATTMTSRYGVAIDFVPNGVAVARGPHHTGILAEFALQPQRYVMLAARLVPEKRQLDLIKAFAKSGLSGVRLVLAGGAEFESAYVQQVKDLAQLTPGVVLTGFRTGDELAELFENAALFVLPSSHEGMPIALLEAMAHGLPVLASDIAANLELDLPVTDYFPLGDVDQLAVGIARKLAVPFCQSEKRAQIARVEDAYSWSGVVTKTLQVYQRALGR